MRRLPVFLAFFGILGLAGLHAMYAGGIDDSRTETYVPEYMGWKTLRSAIKSENPKAIAKRGKIGIRGNLLFINEPNKGIHVFDNRDPSAPKAVAFLSIPGNVDLAIRGDVLFADSFVDLVALDIGALPEVKELNRQADVFPYDPLQITEEHIWYNPDDLDKTKGVVIAWKKVERSK